MILWVTLVDQWNDQAVIKMLHRSLTTRGYATWFDGVRPLICQLWRKLYDCPSWLDSAAYMCAVINMKGSTMDAMSDAIEGAAVMLYGISKAYKESVNVSTQSPYSTRVVLPYRLTLASHVCENETAFQCRLEANYAHQQELDMIPLMMQKEYKPIGCTVTTLQSYISAPFCMMIIRPHLEGTWSV